MYLFGYLDPAFDRAKQMNQHRLFSIQPLPNFSFLPHICEILNCDNGIITVAIYRRPFSMGSENISV
jgi:hypothetical protein